MLHVVTFAALLEVSLFAIAQQHFYQHSLVVILPQAYEFVHLINHFTIDLKFDFDPITGSIKYNQFRFAHAYFHVHILRFFMHSSIFAIVQGFQPST